MNMNVSLYAASEEDLFQTYPFRNQKNLSEVS